ncbi:MAG: MarR family transcriptional regulator [Firmicutes bacterium HGW-Firmicutes-14]|jgi:DNA-binding MarR family transcriptional regulator|nr:MAG: MarR family transcriptional regulator [Firmicutes bacterium HGW-Firmicutes-14]
MEKKQLNSYAGEIKNLFRCIGKNYRNYVLEQVSKCGFTVPQLMVMHEVYNYPGITLKELSEKMGLAKSTVCGIIDRLEARDAVTRTRDTNDRRSVRISLTPKVTELQDSLNVIRTNYLAGLLEHCEADEIKNLVSGLRKLNNLMEEKGF